MKKSIIYTGMILLTLFSCENDVKNQESNETPEEEFRKKVTGQWIARGLDSDTQVVFLPNGKGFHEYYLDARTGKITSHKEYRSWTIKKGYYINERYEFLYVDVEKNETGFFIDKSLGKLIVPFGGKHSFMDNSGELQLITVEEMEKKYPSGSVYEKIEETEQ